MSLVDFKLSDGDIAISNGDFEFTDGPEGTRQRIEQKLRLWRGEWFLDVTAGVPWLRDILGQRPRPEVINSLIRRVVRDDPGVRSVTSLDIEFTGEGRQLRVTFTAQLVDGGRLDNVEVVL